MIKDGNSRLANFSRGTRYRQQKKQVEQIIRRIDRKRSMEIFIERSEGSLIQNQIQNKRKIQIKRQELLIRNKKKLMLQKRKTFSFNPVGQQIKSERRHATQTPQKLIQIIDRQKNANIHQIQKVTPQIMAIQHKFMAVQSQPITVSFNDHLQINRISNDLEYLNYKSIRSIHGKKLGIRPALEQLQDFLEEKDPAVLSRRRRIVEMLVLCLMRRCHNKLYEALDIAIDTSEFFQNSNKEILLKCICLKLIRKIYKEISKAEESMKANVKLRLNQGKKNKRLMKRRHSSFMIKTLTSQRVFLTRFAHRYSKSKLLRESSYLSEQKKYREVDQKRGVNMKRGVRTFNGIREGMAGSDDNICPINEQEKIVEQNKIIIRMSKKLAMSLPSPKVLFASENKSEHEKPQQMGQITQNYKIVIHQRDIESTNKLFPYQYPLSLQKFMNKQQYTFLISSINSIIFSETQCYDFWQVLKEFITHIMGLILVLLILLLYLEDIESFSVSNWIIVGLLTAIWTGILFLIVKENRSSIYAGKRYKKMVKQLSKWNEKYRQINLKFKTTQNCEAIIICWPTGSQQDIQSGPSLQEADSINEDSLSSQQRSIEANHLQNNILLNEIATSQDGSDQKDQVIYPEFKLQNPIQIENNSPQSQPIRQIPQYPVHDQKCNPNEEIDSSELQDDVLNLESQKMYRCLNPFPIFKNHAEDFHSQTQSSVSSKSSQTEIGQKYEKPQFLSCQQISTLVHQAEANYQNEPIKKTQKPETKVPNSISRSKLKEIHDIIETQNQAQASVENQLNFQVSPQQMCFEVMKYDQKKVYSFKYLTSEQSDSQSVQENYATKNSENQDRDMFFGSNSPIPDNGAQNTMINQQKVQKMLEQRLLLDLMFESEEEDEVIESQK